MVLGSTGDGVLTEDCPPCRRQIASDQRELAQLRAQLYRARCRRCRSAPIHGKGNRYCEACKLAMQRERDAKKRPCAGWLTRRGRATRARVAAVEAQHPTWTARQVAKAAGVCVTRVHQIHAEWRRRLRERAA